ncbi:MAG: hemolysin family protein [Thermoguttaceae bacterium]
MDIVELVVIMAMVLCNGVFAGYEIALAAVTVPRLQVLLREGRAGSKAALYMKENMEASLAGVQLAITLCGALAAAIGGVGAAEDIKPFLHDRVGLSPVASAVLAVAVVVVPLTFLTIMFGELMPKVFSLRNKEWVCLRLSPVMRWFCLSVWPIVWLFETAVMGLMAWSERRWRPKVDASAKREAAPLQELRAHAAYARASRLIGEREEHIILGAARFSSRTVQEIMLPAENISMLNVNASLGESLVAAHLDMHTRFPVAQQPGDPQSIRGYVNFKDLVALMRLSPHEASLKAILRPLPSLDANLKLTACQERMIREHAHIALVRDAAGLVVGLITLEDILEELVGDIQDEYDRLPVHVVPSGWAWVVGGGLPLDRLKELTGIDLTSDPPPKEHSPEGGVRTLSDWILGHLPDVVHGGEILERGDVRIVVRKIRRQKVLEAQVERTTRDKPSDTTGEATN